MKEIISEALKYFIEVLVIALIGVATYYLKTVVVPWLQDKKLYQTIVRYVQAAEKLAQSGKLETGADKFYYVANLIEDGGQPMSAELCALIESAVKELDLQAGATKTEDKEETTNG